MRPEDLRGVGGGGARTVRPHGPRDAATQGPGSDLNEPSRDACAHRSCKLWGVVCNADGTKVTKRALKNPDAKAAPQTREKLCGEGPGICFF